MDELRAEFVSETRETLERIAGALIAWELRPEDPVQLDEIFRFVHTVKGSCGFLDLPRIEALAHAAETALAAVRSGARNADATMVATMLAIIDRLGLLVNALEAPDTALPPVESDAALVTALETGRAIKANAEQDQAGPSRTVRIGVPLLEAMMNQVSELVLVRNELARTLRNSDDTDLHASFERLGGIVGELRESVTRTRMQPIDRLFATLPRLVRDTARDCCKLVTLKITGQDVEIDREMVEAIRDPLVHIVRNAIDHGIESADDRCAQGKSAQSILRINAAQSGNQVSIEVIDDGRGIDTSALVQKAIASKLIEPARAALLDEAEAAALIFKAGVSTAASITTISGRGVGMDVVRANVERLGGSVTLVNRPGQGLSITLRAPLTLSIVNALVVHAGGQRFAIPRGAIEEVVSLRSATVRLETVGGGLVAIVRGVAHTAFALTPLLEMSGGDPTLLVMLATPAGGRYGLAVDAVGDHEELVVRPMAPQIAARGVFAGQSLGDDGRPVVILDPVGLAAMGGLTRAEELPKASSVEIERAAPSVVTATTFDGRKVAVRAALVERLIETVRADWTCVADEHFVFLDGRHVSATVMGTLPMDGDITAILLHDGMRHAVFAVAQVHDLVALPELKAVARKGSEGLFRYAGEAIELLDALAFFGNQTVSECGIDGPVAAIALPESPWARAILAPMLEAAGYRVRFGATGAADLVVHLEGDDSGVDAACAVALERGADGQVAVERYDRAKLRGLVSPFERKAA